MLLHITSLPGPWGAGDLGPNARAWLDYLAGAGASIWQVLPLQPSTEGGSEPGCPYLAPSAFAYEPTLVSLDDLVSDGWLKRDEIPPYTEPGERIDFMAVRAHRMPLLTLAAERAVADPRLAGWRKSNPWVEIWGTFKALQEQHGGDWTRWPKEVRDATPARARKAVDAAVVDVVVAIQWLIDVQWARLRAHAHRLGVQIWGDMPIFVGMGAADVWAHRELWRLRKGITPLYISGVPPDFFSPRGQRWGHPLYDVPAHQRTRFRWWRDRARVTLARNDVVRIDHFRGLAAWWQVPASAEDAINGKWVPGLGAALLEAFKKDLGTLPFVAEDLGVITPDVERLRDRFGLPGMAVLQFGWDGNAGNPHHPTQHRKNQVVYTGTHDSDTTFGWAASLSEDEAIAVAARIGCTPAEIPERMMTVCWTSVADYAIVPAQDLLGLGSDARMNTPGTSVGNWNWRLNELPGPDVMKGLELAIRESGRSQRA